MIVQFGIEAKIGAGRRESHIHMLALAEARRRGVRALRLYRLQTSVEEVANPNSLT
jgi:hypothetical protein